jgi:hypothetical protein
MRLTVATAVSCLLLTGLTYRFLDDRTVTVQSPASQRSKESTAAETASPTAGTNAMGSLATGRS